MGKLRLANSRLFTGILLIFVWLMVTHSTPAQTTAFTYQGKLTDAGNPANGTYDLQFRLFDALAGGNLIGSAVLREDVNVSNGVFTVSLDFGAAAFPGANRFLEIGVRPGASTGAFTTLSPLQPISATPYAIKSLSATSADSLSVSCVGCVTSSQIGSLPTNSGNYVQNTTTPQASANFNISGDGTAGGTLAGNIVNATTQYNLNGMRVLSNPGQRNLFAGEGAGLANSGNGSNSFFGYHAGLNNTTGVRNNFFGGVAGESNVTGNDNNFFGDSAGRLNTTASGNSFFGSFSGSNNSSGNQNAFFGYNSGNANNTGSGNSYFGYRAGQSATNNDNSFFGNFAGASTSSGINNSFFGSAAGYQNTIGGHNAFFGMNAGDGNTSGSHNTLIGSGTGVGYNNLTYATAIGSGAFVSASNTIALGRPGGQDTVRVQGMLVVGGLGEATATHLCINTGTFELAHCSSSLRYKSNVASLNVGLNLISRLRPVTFDWKESKEHDLGLIAEEVAEVEPLLVTHNAAGQLQGVKYDQLNVVLINAVKEQQALIQQQQAQLTEQKAQLIQQQSELADLKRLVCQLRQQAAACRTNQPER